MQYAALALEAGTQLPLFWQLRESHDDFAELYITRCIRTVKINDYVILDLPVP